MAQAAKAKVESVTFYAWIEVYPSSMTIRISGGTRAKDANTGAILAMEHKEAKFNMGLLRTDDPEVIAEIRRLIEKGETITEDKEVYLAHVEPPKRREERLAKSNHALKATNAQLEKEVAELRAKLSGKAS